MFQKRSTALTVILFILAFIVCGIAWMRFFYVAAANPSPVRYVDFAEMDGARDPFRQLCYGPAFVEGDTVWRFCDYDAGLALVGDDLTGERGLVRFDLTAGRALLHWPLPEPPDAQILALAQAPTGELAIAWGAPDLSAVYRIAPDGGATLLDGLPADLGEVAGLAWVGPAVELVAQSEDGVMITTFSSVAWSDPRPVTLPDGCGAVAICALQVAYHTGADWRFVIARVLRDPADPPVIDLLLAAEDGSAESLLSLPLADVPQVTRDEGGSVMRVGVLLDRAPGGVINWQIEAAPWTYDPATQMLSRVELPAAADPRSLYAANYAIEGGHLRWLPGVLSPQRAWQVGDTWYTLRRSADGVALAEFGGEPGPLLTTNTSFVQVKNGTQAALLPASDGDLWLVGPYGAYVKADRASLGRTDALNVIERIRRAFENFGRLRPYNDTFYREQRLLKILAFPLVLLSLPAGYLLVFCVRQFRKNTRAWILLLLQVSGFYLILVTIFMWWFWEMMNTF